VLIWGITNVTAGDVFQVLGVSGNNVTVTNTPKNGHRTSTITGTGGANTNFTGNALGGKYVYIDGGTTNVNFVAIMNYSSSVQLEQVYIITNRTATSRTVSFGTSTNNWIPLQLYDGTSGPYTVTNSQALWLTTSTIGTNVYYAAKHMANPSN
jgi:hypothetical protein